MTAWRGDVLAREAMRNLDARPGRFLLLVGIVAATLLSIAVGELFMARGVERTYRALIAHGYTTAKITGSGGIPARACVRLDGQRGVVAAGGVGTVHTVHAGSSPGLGFWTAGGVGDVVAALTGTRPPPARRGVLLSTDLAQQLGVTTGSYLVVAGRPEQVLAVLPLAARDELLGRVLLLPKAPLGRVQACYVQVDAAEFDAAISAVSGAFPDVAELDVTPLAYRGPGAPRPGATWSERPTRFGWVAAGGLLGGVLLLTARGRRHELSVYLVTGSSRAEVGLIYLIESALVVAAAAAVTGCWTAVIALLGHAGWEPFRAAILALVKSALLALALAPAGLSWLTRSDLATVLRERAS